MPSNIFLQRQSSGKVVRITARHRQAFLEALAETASVSRAAELSGIGRARWYACRRRDPAFAAAWDEALDQGTDALEDEAVRRALEGVDKPVFRGNEIVGHLREYSDRLLVLMLKARRPEKFKERGSGEVCATVTIEGARDELARRLDRLAAALSAEANEGQAPSNSPSSLEAPELDEEPFEPSASTSAAKDL